MCTNYLKTSGWSFVMSAKKQPLRETRSRTVRTPSPQKIILCVRHCVEDSTAWARRECVTGKLDCRRCSCLFFSFEDCTITEADLGDEPESSNPMSSTMSSSVCQKAFLVLLFLFFPSSLVFFLISIFELDRHHRIHHV